MNNLKKEQKALIDLWLECNENIERTKLELTHWGKTRTEIEVKLYNLNKLL